MCLGLPPFAAKRKPPKNVIFKETNSQNFDFEKLCGTTALLRIHPMEICEGQYSQFSSVVSATFEPSNNTPAKIHHGNLIQELSTSQQARWSVTQHPKDGHPPWKFNGRRRITPRP